MDRSQVDGALDRLADPALPADQAESLMSALDASAPDALPWVYRRLQDASDEAQVRAASRVLARWAYGPLAGPLAKALTAMVSDPAVSDLAKVAGAALLELLGCPLDDAQLRAAVRDPAEMGRRALRAALEAAERPAALVRLVDSAAARPSRTCLALIDDLVLVAEPRTAWLLGPLTHHSNADIAVSAVAAVDILHLAACRPLVAVCAAHHPSSDVRRQALSTLARIPSGHVGPRWPRVRAFCSGPGSSSVRVLAIGCRPDTGAPAGWDVLTTVIDDRTGVRDYAVADRLTDGGLNEVLERFSSGGTELAGASALEAARLLTDAAARNLADAANVTPGWLAWPYFLGAAGQAES